MFNLDEYDEHKFYKSVTQATSHQMTQAHSVTATAAAVNVLQTMPYIAYQPNFMSDKEYFGG